MSYEIIEDTAPARYLAVKRFSASPDQMGARISAAFGEVFGYLGRHRIAPLGPPVGCYEMGSGKFVVRAGTAVDVPISAEGDVEPYYLPETEVLSTVHVGPYDELPKAYDALEARARELGRELDPTLMWEEYLSGPEVPADQMRTVVHWPLRD